MERQVCRDGGLVMRSVVKLLLVSRSSVSVIGGVTLWDHLYCSYSLRVNFMALS